MKSIRIQAKNVKKVHDIEIELQLEAGVIAIAGDNGTGKSTLLACIAQLFAPQTLAREIPKSCTNANISYHTPYGQSWTWSQTQDGWELSPSSSLPDLNLNKSFFEASLINGTRFTQLQNKYCIKQIRHGYRPADPFITENLEYIINNSSKPDCFQNLYYYDVKRDRKRRVYFIGNDDSRITEFDFSSGEYLTLALLKIVLGLSQKPNNKLRLLIIDEIDLALHPLAQKRLITKLETWAKDMNLLIVIATHSLVMLNEIAPRNIFYIEAGRILNPIQVGYVTSQLYQHSQYDKIILVEDTLANDYLEYCLGTCTFDSHVRYCIIPTGGYTEVLAMYHRNLHYRYFGNAEVCCILDGDIKPRLQKKNKTHALLQYLPFNNPEYALCKYIAYDAEFRISIESLIYPVKLQALEQTGDNELMKKLLELQSHCNDEEYINTVLKTDNVKNIYRRIREQYSGNPDSNEKVFDNKIAKLLFDKVRDTAENKKLCNFLEMFLGGSMRDN